MEKEIWLKRKVVFEGRSEELYGTYPFHQFLTKAEIDRDSKHCDIDVYPDSYTDAEAKDISIEAMKVLIQKAEDAGANYIQIDYHCDHEEYEVYGSLLTRASQVEKEKIEQKERISKKLKVLGRIRGLEAEIGKLKREFEII